MTLEIPPEKDLEQLFIAEANAWAEKKRANRGFVQKIKDWFIAAGQALKVTWLKITTPSAEKINTIAEQLRQGTLTPSHLRWFADRDIQELSKQFSFKNIFDAQVAVANASKQSTKEALASLRPSLFSGHDFDIELEQEENVLNDIVDDKLQPNSSLPSSSYQVVFSPSAFYTLLNQCEKYGIDSQRIGFAQQYLQHASDTQKAVARGLLQVRPALVELYNRLFPEEQSRASEKQNASSCADSPVLEGEQDKVATALLQQLETAKKTRDWFQGLPGAEERRKLTQNELMIAQAPFDLLKQYQVLELSLEDRKKLIKQLDFALTNAPGVIEQFKDALKERIVSASKNLLKSGAVENEGLEKLLNLNYKLYRQLFLDGPITDIAPSDRLFDKALGWHFIQKTPLNSSALQEIQQKLAMGNKLPHGAHLQQIARYLDKLDMTDDYSVFRDLPLFSQLFIYERMATKDEFILSMMMITYIRASKDEKKELVEYLCTHQSDPAVDNKYQALLQKLALVSF